MRCSIWCGGLRGRMGRSRRPKVRERFGLPLRECGGGAAAAGADWGAWWRAGSGRAACIASGAMRRCCGRSGGSRWRGCARRWSRWSSATLARLFTRWQGVVQPRRGLDALLDVIENLQGAPLPASMLETEILPARLLGYKPADLDTLIAAGEVVWVGLEPIGERDGRVGLYLAEKLPLLWPVGRRSQRAASEARAEATLR